MGLLKQVKLPMPQLRRQISAGKTNYRRGLVEEQILEHRENIKQIKSDRKLPRNRSPKHQVKMRKQIATLKGRLRKLQVIYTAIVGWDQSCQFCTENGG